MILLLLLIMDDYIEFINEIKKVHEPRVHKITNSYGVYDAFKYYRKNRPSYKKFVLSESQYFAIIRNINAKLGILLSQGESIKFPNRMGTLEIRKYIVEPRIDKNGKFVFKPHF